MIGASEKELPGDSSDVSDVAKRRSAIDPTLSLALALRATPGAYALLIGSGVSRSAEIPTGWEVVLDLTRKVALLEGADVGDDAAGWYRTRFDEEPDYSKLLEALAGTQSERRDLLKSYFEPSAEDREVGRKLPTTAHRAIARLVAGGYVRVILTTNFDQLLETAIRDEGIVPAVISSAEAVAGGMPLQHERVTIVKLHGDYLDVRIKNTPEELASYDPAFDRLLDRALDEYGLVVCGWSAAWDEALRAAITRCPNRRFSTFWAAKGALAPEAERLVELRRAAVIAIGSADAFFETVAEKVASLEELDGPHPISRVVAVASLKRYLPSEASRIRLHDLLMEEVETVRARALGIVPTTRPDNATIIATIPKLEASSETLMALMATGAQWGEPRHRPLWRKVLERLGNTARQDGSQWAFWTRLLMYPAQLAFYAAGVAAAAVDDETLACLLLEPVIDVPTERRAAPAFALNCYKVIEHDAAKLLPGYERRYTPMSDRLASVVRESLRETLPDEAAFDAAFDRFELIVALTYMHATLESRVGTWFPIGRVSWRRQNMSDAERDPVRRLKAEIDREGSNWFLLRHGLFGGSLETLAGMYDSLIEQANRRGW